MGNLTLKEALATADHTARGPVCSVAKALGNDDDDGTLAAALADGRPHATLSRQLREAGVRLTAAAIGRHRKGDCLCGL